VPVGVLRDRVLFEKAYVCGARASEVCGMPGRPITPSQLGERLRALGVRAMPGRRAALIDLAAQLPAAVLADCLNLSPGTAVRWMHQAGANWNRYAADLARSRNHQP